ncbi:cytochrome c oxidase subunit II [Halorarius halobius]|uniref:cytochrome c oxidase subunit II n=1 Tax=Halorarius halobius TaxID=2962671 RepID=UPI0020CB8551|nr:cytochrome c oxidase subunit II [Halorarius halobius]
MRRRRLGTLALAALAVVWLFAAPAAAQSVNRDLFEQLNTQLLYVALPLTVFVEVILVYAVVRFRGNPDPKPTIADPPLEITWTAATAVILLFVGFSAYTVLATPYMSPAGSAAAAVENPETAPDDAVVVDVVAYQFGWEARYPAANVSTQGELVVPTDREVYLRLRSQDVIHSLFVPDWGIKQDVFPGQTTLVRTRVYEPGSYRIYCAELCGVGHSRMRATATAVPDSTYREWLDDHRNETGVTDAPRPANATA